MLQEAFRNLTGGLAQRMDVIKIEDILHEGPASGKGGFDND